MSEIAKPTKPKKPRVELSKAIVIGNTAKLLDPSDRRRFTGCKGDPREQKSLRRSAGSLHTHEWKWYVRSYNDEDLSKYILKIEVTLHKSYSNPVRVLSQTPFELCETGYGEFELLAKFFFCHSNQPITCVYFIKLFDPKFSLKNGSEIVCNELYDEIVFVCPSEQLTQLLHDQQSLSIVKTSLIEHDKEIENLRHQLEEENKRILAEIAEVRENLRSALRSIEGNQVDTEEEQLITADL